MKQLFLGFSCVLSVALIAACGDDANDDEGSGGSTAGSGGSTAGSGGSKPGSSAGSGGASVGGSAGSGGKATGGSGTAGTSTGLADTGEPCTAASECATIGGAESLCKTDWPGGYCTKLCSGNLCTGSNARCEDHDGDRLCLQICGDAEECRSGYTCSFLNVCVPE